MPQDLGKTGEAKISRWVVLEMPCSGCRRGGVKLSEEVQGTPPQLDMGICKACRIVPTLGQAQHLLPQLSCGLELSPADIKRHQAMQHGEDLRGVTHFLDSVRAR